MLKASIAVGLIVMAAHVQADGLRPPANTVYKCVVGEKVHYSDTPCLGAEKIDVTPTRGIDKSSGGKQIGNDVDRELRREQIAESLRPLTDMNAKKVGRQAASSGIYFAATSDALMASCLDVDSAFGYSANNLHSPLGVVFERLGYRWNSKESKFDVPVKVSASIKVRVFEHPKSGRLTKGVYENTWNYVANRDYVGKDRAIYSVQVDGVDYRVILNFLVHQVLPEPNTPPACEMEFGRPPKKSGNNGFYGFVEKLF